MRSRPPARPPPPSGLAAVRTATPSSRRLQRCPSPFHRRLERRMRRWERWRGGGGGGGSGGGSARRAELRLGEHRRRRRRRAAWARAEREGDEVLRGETVMASAASGPSTSAYSWDVTQAGGQQAWLRLGSAGLWPARAGAAQGAGSGPGCVSGECDPCPRSRSHVDAA